MRGICSLLFAAIVPLSGPSIAASSENKISVTIGVLNDRSGIYADISGDGSVAAARMAVEDFKAEQQGLDVRIISADHQNKPDVGASIARKWYDTEGVDAIVDVPTSSVALAVSEITREKDRVFLNSGAATSDLTGSHCSPNTIHWTYDTKALANGTGRATVKAGGKTWFFLTADYAFGHALERDTTRVVEEAGGRVIGSVNTPFPSMDFSSYLLQAQASGAKVIGLANAGGDTINAVKQASEFAIMRSGQKLAGLLVFATDVKALGLQRAQGLLLTSPFYWNLNDATRAWSERFAERTGGELPTMVHAGVYSSTLHYLKAVKAAGTTDAKPVLKNMKMTVANDSLFGQGRIRADGRKMHDVHLFEVKKPSESSEKWDFYKLVATIPAEEAFGAEPNPACRMDPS